MNTLRVKLNNLHFEEKEKNNQNKKDKDNQKTISKTISYLKT